MAVTPLLVICLVVATFASHAKSEAVCRAIPIQDIVDASILSKAAYSDIKVDDELEGGSGYVVKKVIKEGVMQSRILGQPLKVVVATLSDPPTTMIGFMGTKSVEQLLTQFKKAVSEEKTIVEFKGKTVGVMAYFWNAFQQLWRTLREMKINRKMKYIITGHSLGGALASLYGIEMVQTKKGYLWKNPESVLITFGQPRVGGKAYAELHDKLLPAFKKPRLVLDKDIVPHMPPMLMGYQHTSREIWIQEVEKKKFGWKKVGFGMKLPWVKKVKVMEWHVCPKGDHMGICRNGKLAVDATDHDMSDYRDAVDKLKEDEKEVKKFEEEQCLVQGNSWTDFLKGKI